MLPYKKIKVIISLLIYFILIGINTTYSQTDQGSGVTQIQMEPVETMRIRPPAQCLLELPTPQLSFDSDEGPKTLQISVAFGCNISVSDDQTWISTSLAPDQQSVTISVSENSGSARTGYVTIEDYQIQIDQAKVAPPNTPSAIIGGSNFDANESSYFSVSAVSGATSYTWILPSGSSYISGAGTGNIHITLGNVSGYLKVKANNIGGSSAYQQMYITVSDIVEYTVTGGGSYCVGGEGHHVGLSDSQTGVSYQLKRNGINTGTAKAGTGSALDFGEQLLEGTYTVIANFISSGYSKQMPSNVSIVVNPIPANPINVIANDRIGPGEVNLSAEHGSNGNQVNWYSAGGDFIASGNSYNPVIYENKTYIIKTYNTTTGCESYGRTVDVYVKELVKRENNDTRSNELNYSRKITPKVPVKHLAEFDYMTTDQVVDEVQYLDGLGRAIQSQVSGTGDFGESMVQFYSYDEFGRADSSFLPFTHRTEGKYLEDVRTTQINYYNNGSSDKIVDDNSPFTTVKFDDSPLSRVIESSSVGDLWQIKSDNSGSTVRSEYLTNDENDNVILFKNISGIEYEGVGLYEPGKLFKNVIIDENGKSVTTFVNQNGKLILKDQEGLRTYYIYDIYGRLNYVLPPEFVENMTAPKTIVINTSKPLVKQYCFVYIYGERSLLVEKYIPGIEKIEYVYDKVNRPVLSRNGNLREHNQWSFIKYDEYGRVAYSGIYTDNDQLTREQLQDVLITQECLFETYNVEQSYSNNVFPQVNNDIHIINVYDFYPELGADFLPSENPIDPFNNTKHYINANNEIDTSCYKYAKGRLTMSKVKIMDGSVTPNYMETVVYYDKYNRVIQKHSDNIFEKVDIVNMTYNFMGQVTEQVVEHTMPEDYIEQVSKYYNYDHANRLKSVEQEIEADTVNGRVKMLEMEYNKLGQVVAKKLHETADESFLQTIDYKYNIRGWLTDINDPNDQGDDNDLFAMRMYYNDQITQENGRVSEGLNNGMISAIEWNAFDDNPQKRAYSYEYDDHYRLTSAHYSAGDNLDADTSRYDVSLSYTANGKINTLKRSGLIDDITNPEVPVFGLIDDLTYEYNGNQLIKVNDAVNSPDVKHEIHFPDKIQSLDDEYNYDKNGNMIADANKQLQTIEYNHLNLPELVKFDPDNYILFTYDAAGNKLRKEVVSTGNDTIIYNFVGGFVYLGEELAQIATEVGQVELDNANNTYSYEYFLKDHLGSVRVVFKEGENNEAESLEENHYYPFGMRITGLGKQKASNTRMFSGKDLQKEVFNGVNLNWYDFGARNYDPQLGMWFNVDPLAETEITNTPYNYCANNPVNYTDPNGMKKRRPVEVSDFNWAEYAAALGDGNDMYFRNHSTGGGGMPTPGFQAHCTEINGVWVSNNDLTTGKEAADFLNNLLGESSSIKFFSDKKGVYSYATAQVNFDGTYSGKGKNGVMSEATVIGGKKIYLNSRDEQSTGNQNQATEPSGHIERLDNGVLVVRDRKSITHEQKMTMYKQRNKELQKEITKLKNKLNINPYYQGYMTNAIKNYHWNYGIGDSQGFIQDGGAGSFWGTMIGYGIRGDIDSTDYYQTQLLDSIIYGE